MKFLKFGNLTLSALHEDRSSSTSDTEALLKHSLQSSSRTTTLRPTKTRRKRMTQSEDGETAQVIESFDQMGLKELLLRGIYTHGFEKPSPIQARAIKPCCEGKFC